MSSMVALRISSCAYEVRSRPMVAPGRPSACPQLMEGDVQVRRRGSILGPIAFSLRTSVSSLVPDFINTVTYFVRDGHESVKADLCLGVRSCRGGVLLTSY
jgi:hypothetical protein